MKRNENNNQLLKSISMVLLTLVAFLLIFAIFFKFEEYEKSSFKLDVNYDSSNSVELTNKLPISDAIGINYNGKGVEKGIAEYKKITITNPNPKKVEYEVFLTKSVNEISDIKSNYIKLYLTDDKDEPLKGFESKLIPSYYDLYSLNDKPSSSLLYRGSLAPNKSDTIVLRSWLADTYVITTNLEDFNFDIDVRIK